MAKFAQKLIKIWVISYLFKENSLIKPAIFDHRPDESGYLRVQKMAKMGPQNFNEIPQEPIQAKKLINFYAKKIWAFHIC